MTAVKRNRRSGVADRWKNRDGSRSVRYGKGKRWLARYVNDEGEEVTASFDLKDDAQAFLDEQVSDLVTGRYVNKRRASRTVGSLAEEWIAHKQHLKPKTVAGYRSLLDTQVLTKFKDRAVGDMTFSVVRNWVLELQTATDEHKALSASRVIQAYQVLKGVLDDAVKLRLIPSNPCSGVQLPRKQETERRYLTHQQVEALANQIGVLKAMVLVLAYCGLRFGEAAALKVKHVDTKNNRLNVLSSVTFVSGTGFVEGTTKGGESRSVPVPQFLSEVLKTHTKGMSSDALVFGGKDGWITPGEFRWKFDPAATAADLQGLVPHELRHTAASLAIKSGANVKVVQRMLGHKSATLTLDRYGHLFPDELDALATRLDEDRIKALAD